jgi:uncharacterized protein YkwD
VDQRIVLVVVAVVVAAGLVMGRAVTLPGPSPAAESDKRSACGRVQLPAEELGLASTRALTLCLLNAERARRGIAPLRAEARLELASQRHSDDMVARRFFEHDTPEGTEPQGRILATGYPADNAYTGENLAWGEGAESSPVEIVDGWMHSPGHRENILRRAFTEVGVGVTMAGPEDSPKDMPAATYTTDFGGPPVRAY